MRTFARHLEVDRFVAGASEDVPGVGVLLRSPRFPHSWDLNQVVLAVGATMEDVARAVEVAEAALEGAAHRRLTVPAPTEEVVAPDGWEREELLVMEVSGSLPWPDGVEVVEPRALRSARLEMWRAFNDDAVAEELADMQEAFAAYPGARVLGVADADGAYVAWAQVANGCIDDVWVVEPRRGSGLGRAVTTAAVAAGGTYLWTDVGDPRPQGLYRSLGFAETGRIVQLTRHL